MFSIAEEYILRGGRGGDGRIKKRLKILLRWGRLGQAGARSTRLRPPLLSQPLALFYEPYYCTTVVRYDDNDKMNKRSLSSLTQSIPKQSPSPTIAPAKDEAYTKMLEKVKLRRANLVLSESIPSHRIVSYRIVWPSFFHPANPTLLPPRQSIHPSRLNPKPTHNLDAPPNPLDTSLSPFPDALAPPRLGRAPRSFPFPHPPRLLPPNLRCPLLLDSHRPPADAPPLTSCSGGRTRCG